MKTKTKLVTCVVMAILVMSMLVVGVFAVKTANFQVGGNITFNAKGIYATISEGSLANCSFTDGSVAGTDKLKAITINTDKTETQINSEFLSWQGLNLKFDDDMSAKKTTATLTFTITNTAATGSNEYIDISVSTSATEMKNARVSVANSKNAGAYVLQPQEALTCTITFTILDTTANASLSGFEIDFNMQRLTALPTISYTNAQAKGLDFAFDEGNKTASAKKATTVPTSDWALEIPRMVTKDGVNYTVTSLATSAFGSCSGLTSVNIPESVTSIGENAFYRCSSLTSITIPNSVTSIGNHAFYDCSGLESIVVDSNNPIYDSRNNCNAIIETNSNTLIAGCKNTIIPDSVTSIGGEAFSECTSLTSITIPDSVTSIGEKAFSECTSLTSITIPESVTSIGDSAFYSCRSLTSITIPESVTSIGKGAFAGCSGLDYNKYDNGYYLGNSENPYIILVKAKNTSIISCEINTKTKFIHSSAFYYCTSLTSSITIPDGVTSIGEGAFSECTSLTSITIPNSVTSIGSDAFGSCSGLDYNKYDNGYYLGNSENPYIILVEAKDTSIISCEINTKTKFIHSSAFDSCSGLTSITIPDSVTSIGGQAFSDCTSLTSITIPDSVTSIGDRAFGSCSGLTSVTIPDSVTSIGEDAFWYCRSLTSITIPDSVTSIGEKAFYRCSSLTSITIPNSVTSIGNHAFYDCSGLESIVVDSDNPIYDSRNNCNAIIETNSNTLIAGCKNTIIPDSVTSIGGEAFRGCSGLTSITIPDKVTSIGSQAFYGCSSLTSITIPDGVTSIGSDAFYGCRKLVEVYNLSQLNITKNSQDYGRVGYYALDIYPSLETPSKLSPDKNGYMFYEDSANSKYYFIGYNGSETALTLPSKSYNYGINQGAFYGCSSLTSITIPDSVISIGDWAFAGCSKLTSITIPDTVTSIGEDAFYSCRSLTSVTIGNSVTSIGNSAFYYCSSLTSITIPDSVTSIGSEAFAECSGLTSATFKNTEGWFVGSSASATSGIDLTSSNLANTTTAATYLTSTHCNYRKYWIRRV